ncbi:hypothetical protein PoB_000679000 [Plakobranchus ocellatus]|uniref:Uncharacterized protein n=1 Tax=Plakobranchus ocellatus TaxID=259542 RepID=A0AAV3YB65_9GAST|nr:hypothetical protein PoB_000679000 [Plakobranchus ocellatus]
MEEVKHRDISETAGQGAGLEVWMERVGGESKLTTVWFGVLNKANPQQGDLRLSGSPSGQGAGGGAQTLDRPRQTDPCRCQGYHYAINASCRSIFISY